jgi:hypothetical protein
MIRNINTETASLKKMTLAQLREKYADVFGESTRSRHKAFLIRRILWRLQANEEGDLSARARQRAKELAMGADVRLTAPKTRATDTAGHTQVATLQLSEDPRLPMPGAILTREYKGERVEVRVLPGGFEYEGEIYRTLSAVAKQVTGAHWNGYHFFGLGKKGNDHGRKED